MSVCKICGAVGAGTIEKCLDCRIEKRIEALEAMQEKHTESKSWITKHPEVFEKLLNALNKKESEQDSIFQQYKSEQLINSYKYKEPKQEPKENKESELIKILENFHSKILANKAIYNDYPVGAVNLAIMDSVIEQVKRNIENLITAKIVNVKCENIFEMEHKIKIIKALEEL